MGLGLGLGPHPATAVEWKYIGTSMQVPLSLVVAVREWAPNLNLTFLPHHVGLVSTLGFLDDKAPKFCPLHNPAYSKVTGSLVEFPNMFSAGS